MHEFWISTPTTIKEYTQTQLTWQQAQLRLSFFLNLFLIILVVPITKYGGPKPSFSL